jgi:hypothetical protein
MERDQSIFAREDIKQLWNINGSGELFESETVLQPLGATEGKP